MTNEEILSINDSIELEFKDENSRKEWNKFVDINSKDGYSYGVVKYSMYWAKLMQKLMNEGNKLEDIAEKASHDSDIEGITGFMYGCAVNTLSRYWKYGEDLRKWHNNQYGYNGNGVVNPAILTVSA